MSFKNQVKKRQGVILVAFVCEVVRPLLLLYKQKIKNLHKSIGSLFGAGDRGRTGTVSLPLDFESSTSANSITPANITEILYYITVKKSI